MLGQEIQAIGVQHRRQFRFQQPLPGRARPVRTPQARSQRDHVGPPGQRIQRLAVLAVGPHRLGQAAGQRPRMFASGGDRNQAATGHQRRPGRQHRGAGHVVVAAADQHVAQRALVDRFRPRRQHAPDNIAGQAFGVRIQVPVDRFRHLQVVEQRAANAVRCLAGFQSALAPDEAHRDLGMDGLAQHRTGVGVQPGRHIDRNDRGAGSIDRIDHLGVVVANLAVQPGAQQGVDDDIGLDAAGGPGNRTADVQPGFRGPPGVAAQFFGRLQRDHARLHAGIAGQRRHHVAVAAVVASATARHKAFRLREPGTHGAKNGPSGTLHEFVAGDSMILDCPAVELADLLGTIQIVSHSHHHQLSNLEKIELQSQITQINADHGIATSKQREADSLARPPTL